MCIEASSWSQFHALDERPDALTSTVSNVTIRNLDVKVGRFFVVKHRHPFLLKDFKFFDIQVTDRHNTCNIGEIEGVSIRNAFLNGKSIKSK